MNSPLVTIVIFTRNRSAYLRLALRAALAQSYPEFEVLVMDNASTDDTAEVVASFRDPRVRYHRNPFNRGAPVSYQLSLKRARGKYILMSHDDDLMGPDLVARQVEAFLGNPALVAVTANVSVIDEHGRPVVARRSECATDEVFPRGAYIHAWNTRHLWLPFPTLMVRRPLQPCLFLPLSWYRVGSLADIYILAELNAHGPIAFLADPLLAYRQHSQQAQFHYDQVKAGRCLHSRLLALTRSQGMDRYRPLAALMLLKYRLQAALLNSREPLGRQPRLAQQVRGIMNKHARLNRHLAKRAILKDHQERSSLMQEVAANPWCSQASICGHLVQGHEIELQASDPKTGNPFHQWLLSLREGRGLGAILAERGFRRIAVMGSMLNAALVAMDAAQAGVEVACFLDSNQRRCKTTLARLPIAQPKWLQDCHSSIDAVVISSEHGEGERVARMLADCLPPGSPLPIFSWKTLLTTR